MNRLLKNCGCVCYEAEDGKECVEWMALAAANKSPEVDMVLMDYGMPCMIEYFACFGLYATCKVYRISIYFLML